MSPSAADDRPVAPTMDAIVDQVKGGYRSARLQYIKIDEGDEAVKAFLPRVESDPLIQALSSPDIMRPKGKKEIEWYVEQLAKSYLGVAICLLPEEEDSKDKQPRGPTETEAGAGDDAAPTIIGTMCLGWGGIAPLMAHHRTAAVGITLAREHLGRGYGREALNWLLDWGFRHGGLHTINLATYSYNERANRLYESLGFRLEGRKREVAWFDRKWHDELWYGMTESEWEKLRGFH
ncbi:hypothetical protein HIM_01354 [Hirsutella minnesotensis 3608]|nr:hypothetical protein HIM_01354 [Hirsutella minnesotensis 3608]